MKINDYYCIYLLSLLRKWRFVYMFFLVLLSCVSVYAQQNRNISGKVMDEKGEMLPGVSIMLKGTSRGTMSDANGAFSISVSSDTSVLIFSFVGYESQEIPVKKNKQLRVIMTEDVRQLNEVVVMGYGSFSRKDVTGSVAKVDMDELSTIPVSSFSEALEGRVAGVQIQASDGQPGETPGILIRGNNSLTQDNSPLYVVDGFPMEDFDAASISNDDIESLNILKDASATAIYGARAANGVVVITTKKGRKSRPIISFSASLGWQEISKQMEMMSPYEFVRYNLELKPDITERRYLSGCNMTLDDYKNMKGINWQDEIQNDCPLLMTYNLSIRGGNDRTKYSVSGSTYNQNGVIDNSGYDRYTGHSPILTCPNATNDLFTTNTSDTGNKALTYPIGLITVDELMLGGLSDGYMNRLSYTYSSYSYWTMSPRHFSVSNTAAYGFNASSVGSADGNWVTSSNGVRAVINLKSDVQISGGIGTANDPFVVQTT